MHKSWLMKHTKIKTLGQRSTSPFHVLWQELANVRSILTVASMGFFSSDRAIQTYCDEIWYFLFTGVQLTWKEYRTFNHCWRGLDYLSRHF